MGLNILIVFVVGLLAGWLIEWVIDWAYWRRPKKAAPPTQYQSKIRSSAPKSATQEQMYSRVDDLFSKNPMLGDAMASLLSRPETMSKPPEVMAAKVQNGLAVWFDDVMDRSSGDYKRRASKWALVLGTLMAFLLNVDSIEIATRMWQEPTLRQVIVAQAQNVPGTESQGSLDEYIEEVNQLGIPVGWTTVEPQPGQECGWMPGEPVYPAIWSNNGCNILLNLPRMDDGWGWLMKFFGLLISGIAAAQGAPFWFDLLKKVLNMRSTGRAPRTAQSESASFE